jgi:hypothetical protein
MTQFKPMRVVTCLWSRIYKCVILKLLNNFCVYGTHSLNACIKKVVRILFCRNVNLLINFNKNVRQP